VFRIKIGNETGKNEDEVEERKGKEKRRECKLRSNEAVSCVSFLIFSFLIFGREGR
jgi:hypothetical protein